MTVYLVMDVDNMTQHELIEVRWTEKAAQALVDELNEKANARGESASWIWDVRGVEGFLGLPYVVDVEILDQQYAVSVTNPNDATEVSAVLTDAELAETVGKLIVDDLIERKEK